MQYSPWLKILTLYIVLLLLLLLVLLPLLLLSMELLSHIPDLIVQFYLFLFKSWNLFFIPFNTLHTLSKIWLFPAYEAMRIVNFGAESLISNNRKSKLPLHLSYTHLHSHIHICITGNKSDIQRIFMVAKVQWMKGNVCQGWKVLCVLKSLDTMGIHLIAIFIAPCCVSVLMDIWYTSPWSVKFLKQLEWSFNVFVDNDIFTVYLM